MIKYLLIFLLLTSPVYAGVDLDGTDDLLLCGSGATLDDNQTSSYSCWIYVSSYTGGVNNDIIQKLVDAGGFTFELDGTNEWVDLFVFWSGDDGTWRSDASSISTGAWMQIGFSYDYGATTNNPIFYLNGVSINITETSTPTTARQTDASGNLSWGGRDPGVGHGDQTIDGKITECAGWDVILTPAEFLQLASSRVKRMPLQIRPASLVIYTPMDDEANGTSADGDSFIDMSGNGNTCTGDNGANDTGLTAVAEEVLSYL